MGFFLMYMLIIIIMIIIITLINNLKKIKFDTSWDCGSRPYSDQLFIYVLSCIKIFIY